MYKESKDTNSGSQIIFLPDWEAGGYIIKFANSQGKFLQGRFVIQR